MRDRDIRQALHTKLFREHHEHPDTLVLNELGLRHGACRIDIAVVNGFLHGFEIKSDSDTLGRLPGQVAIYSSVLDRATLVVGERYAERATSSVPDWWGIKVVTTGPRGGIDFAHFRQAKINPAIDPIALAELLWRPEVVEILQGLNVPPTILRQPRPKLYSYLAGSIELNQLRNLVRQRLKAREGWRCPGPIS